jgi:glycosyltransferase involved in cell wall biosynthesis
MKLYFAGCARDCADVVASNIATLLTLGENTWCDEIKVFVAENSSKDNTREIISELAEQDDRVIPVFLEDLDKAIPIRDALRDREWSPDSAWKEINDAKAWGYFWTQLVYIRYVSSRQKPHARLQAKGLIPIDSAFGGVGIYSLSQVLNSGARYSSSELEQEELNFCEHVVFNRFLDRLFINSAWVIAAPPEHIEFRVLPAYRKAWRITRAGLGDVKRQAKKILLLVHFLF